MFPRIARVKSSHCGLVSCELLTSAKVAGLSLIFSFLVVVVLTPTLALSDFFRPLDGRVTEELSPLRVIQAMFAEATYSPRERKLSSCWLISYLTWTFSPHYD